MPLDQQWKAALDLQHRRPPDLFEDADDVKDTLYAPAVRIGLSEIGLAAVFCVSGVPTVAIRRSERYAVDEVQRIHGALWNQGLASVFVDITDATVRVFSLARVCAGTDIAQLEEQCLIESLDAATLALERLPTVVSGAETGRLWRENPKYFRPNERIDAVLLNNLEVAHDRLQDTGLTADQAQAALIQTMFIAYLEDREIIDSGYINRATESAYDSWSDLLRAGDTRAIERLFDELRDNFNGDLFVAPCSFSENASNARLSAEHLEILAQFRAGKEEMVMTGGGQLRFWGYDFRYIPIELISAVYDKFMSRDQTSQQNTRAFTTPMFLADTVLSSTWSFLSDAQKENGTFLDPACGSGIFLVKCFQRLCQHRRETTGEGNGIPWDDLVRIVCRIHGRDINPTAVRISTFSLYLALLEQVAQADPRSPLAPDRLLPSLWNRKLVNRDFFDSRETDRSHDVIIGNPPWASRRQGYESAIHWSQGNGYALPAKELAWAFTWKSTGDLNEGGIVAFLLPAMGFLHSQSGPSINARKRLFTETRIQMVADLSDLRKQLFPDSAHSATLIVLSKRPSGLESPYEFAYLAPKADPNLACRRFVPLSSIDRALLRSSEIAINPRLFKERLWLRAPEATLFRYLSGLPRMDSLIERNLNQSGSPRWMVGRGFEAWNEDSSTAPTVSSIVDRVRHLPTLRVTPLKVNVAGLEPWKSNYVRRRGFEQGFRGIRVLVTGGIKTPRGRLRAAYVDRPMTFRHSVIVVTAPEGEEDMAKFITAYLNSRLAIWFAFHGTASFGAERPRVNQTEIVRLPLPFPNDLADPARARKARSELIRLIDEFVPRGTYELNVSGSGEDPLLRVDRLTYEYFGLNHDEIALVEDTVEHTLPALQPPRNAFPKLWMAARLTDRRIYADSLRNRLARWLIDAHPLSVRLIARNDDFSIVELSIDGDRGSYAYREDDQIRFSVALRKLAERLDQPVSGNFLLTPDVRVFAGKKLYLIKPLQRRFWLRSVAFADADAIALDLETLRWNRKDRYPA